MLTHQKSTSSIGGPNSGMWRGVADDDSKEACNLTTIKERFIRSRNQ